MKYNGILCTGHPRSGTHYVTALISLNFLKDDDYLKIYRNHELPDMVQNQNIAYVYVWRKFEDVARSIYALKERFGLGTERYTSFVSNQYSQMWQPGNPDDVVTNVRTLHDKASLNGISNFFEKVDMTPGEYWAYYNRKWAECAEERPNVFGVSYDEMKADFRVTMLDIATKLGSRRTQFKDIERKIGWWK